jgi:hypothetical protein
VAAKTASNPVRLILTIVMDALWVWALILLVAVVVAFFGFLADSSLGHTFLGFASKLVLPLGLKPVHTPYGGWLNVNAAATVLILLAAEWVLSMVRRAV